MQKNKKTKTISKIIIIIFAMVLGNIPSINAFTPSGQNNEEYIEFEQYMPSDPVKYTRDISSENEFIVVCSLENITSLDGSIFKITYDPEEVTLVDFAAQTENLDVSAGIVEDTELEILSHDDSNGILLFEVNKTVPVEQMWSGAVTILKFEAKILSSAAIDFENVTEGGQISIAPMQQSGYSIDINRIMTGIMPETSVTAMLENIEKTGGTLPIAVLKVYDNNGLRINGNTFVGTGAYITYTGAAQELANIAVYGDLNGDGRINPIDLVMLSRHVAEINIIKNPLFEKATDVTGDGKITIADLIRLARYIADIDKNPLGH